MEPGEVRIFESPTAFRTWLDAHHETSAELWIGFYRKGVAKEAMTYTEAVEEALCYGWIDGQARRISDEVWSNRFTPRRRGSNWSAVNLKRVAGLIADGRMHPSGVRAYEERDRTKDATYSYERPAAELPPDWTARFRDNAVAWEQWMAETPSYRRTATYWVMSAKRPETRARRFETLVTDSAEGRRVKPFLVARTT